MLKLHHTPEKAKKIIQHLYFLFALRITLMSRMFVLKCNNHEKLIVLFYEIDLYYFCLLVCNRSSKKNFSYCGKIKENNHYFERTICYFFFKYISSWKQSWVLILGFIWLKREYL